MLAIQYCLAPHLLTSAAWHHIYPACGWIKKMFWYIEAIYNVFIPVLARKGKSYTKQVFVKYASFWNHFNMISLQQALRSLSITYDVTQWMALRVISAQLTAKPNCDIQYKYSSPAEQKNALTLLCVRHKDVRAYAGQRAYLKRGKAFFDISSSEGSICAKYIYVYYYSAAPLLL